MVKQKNTIFITLYVGMQVGKYETLVQQLNMIIVVILQDTITQRLDSK